VSIFLLERLKPLRLSWQRKFSAYAARSVLLFLSIGLWSVCFASPDVNSSLKCGESADAYKGYKVNDIRIVTPLSVKTPFSFLFGSQQKLQHEFAAILPRLPLQKGGKFDRVLNSFSIDALRQVYDEQVVQPGERIRFAVVSYRLENCNVTTESLDVVYVVYSSDFLYYASRIFEKPNDKITRSLAPGKVTNPGSLINTTNKLLPQPLLGYDDARKLFGGTRLSLQSKGGLIDRMDLNLNGSQNSALTDFNLSGSREYNDSWISHLDWRLAYDYFNIPTNDLKLKAGSGVAQLFGASKPLTQHGILLRFGTSVEVGNRQVDADFPLLSLVPDQSGYRAVKSYLGATINRGRQSWSASYGLQLGASADDDGIGFVKHIFDANYRARFLRREHDPIRLDVNFGAGTVHSTNSPIPIVERFFGGNRPRPFIEGDDWIINSSPLIRSFPQYGLSSVGIGAPIGGTNFLSFNLTLSKPVWHIAAVPAEISDDPSIRDALAGALSTARTATLEVYLSDEPPFINLANQLRNDRDPNAIEGTIPELEKAFSPVPVLIEQLKARNPPSHVLDAISEIDDDSGVLEQSKQTLQRITDDKEPLRQLAGQLIVSVTADDEGLIAGLIDGLNSIAESLRANHLPADADSIQRSITELTNVRTAMLPKVKQLLAYGKSDLRIYEPVRQILKNDSSPDDVSRSMTRLQALLDKIEERANDIPNVGRSADFIADDMKDPAEFVLLLQNKKDVVSQFLVTQLSSDTLRQLNEFKPGEPLPKQLLMSLLQDLNRIIHGPSIFQQKRFADVDLSDETSNLAEQNPQGVALIRLNRSLIAEAYPDEVELSRIDNLLDAVDDPLSDAKLMLTLATADVTTTSVDKIRSPIHRLTIGYGDLAPSLLKRISSTTKSLQQLLANAGAQSEAQSLSVETQKLRAFENQAQKAWREIPLIPAEKQTDFDIGYSARALDVVFRELNLIEVSPVLMFDAARIGPQTSPGYGNFRYGVGPAVRFSLVTLDFTAGYSFNVNRKPAESRGSFVFSMTISDLFR